MDRITKNIHRKDWIDLLSQNNRYLITVTLNQDTSEEQSQRTVKSLLKRIRKDYFGRNPKRQFFSGFLVIEHQKWGRPHYHILIQDHPIFRRQDRDFKEVVMKQCRSLSLVDEKRGVDIQDYYQDNLEDYLTKSIEWKQNNFDFIHPLTYDGF